MTSVRETVNIQPDAAVAGKFFFLKKKPFILLAFSLYLVMGLCLYNDYGISFDEPISRYNGVVTAKYLLEIIKPETKNSPQLKGIPALADYKDRDYGVVFELPVFLLEQGIGIKNNNSPNLYKMRHLCTFLVFFVGVIFFFRMVEYRFGNWQFALLGCLFLVVSPRIFAESFYNNKDVVLLSFFIISTYCVIRFLNNKSIKNAIALAVVAALTTSVRILGILVPLVTIGFLVWDFIASNDRKRVLRILLPRCLVFCLVFAFCTVLFWPYLWENPLGNFVQAFSNMSHFRWKGTVLYLGEFVRATQLPWHYIPVWVGITTPVLYLILFAGGVFLIARRVVQTGWRLYNSNHARQDLVFMTLCIGPVVAVIVLNSVLYDGWRQLYFIYGSFLMVALRGLWGWWGWVNEKLRNRELHLARWGTAVAVGVSLLNVAYFMVRYHPFQNMYFNVLAARPIEHTFDRDYWGLSYRQAMEYISKRDNRGKIIIASNNLEVCKSNSLMLPEAEQQRFKYTRSGIDTLSQSQRQIRMLVDQKPDYYITEYRYMTGSNLTGVKIDSEYYALGEEIFSIRVEDFKIIGVYKVK